MDEREEEDTLVSEESLERYNDAVSRLVEWSKGDLGKVVEASEFALRTFEKHTGPQMILILLNLLSKLGLYDFSLVRRMFDAIYRSDGNFLRIFVPILCHKTGEDLRDELGSAEFYLHIGNSQKYVTPNGEKVMMVDVPILGNTLAALAAYRNKTFALRLFLRYGADPQRALEGLTSSHPSRTEAAREIARAIAYPNALIRKMLPHLPKIPSLKHITKVLIRKHLTEGMHLPMGICLLPLPLELQHYLDLNRD